jgi:hypothetical protein
MNRREIIVGLGGAAAALPLAARAQQQATKVPRIGIIDDAPIWDHFRQGLRDLGYIESRGALEAACWHLRREFNAQFGVRVPARIAEAKRLLAQ